MTTLTTVNAIMTVGNNLASVFAGGTSSSNNDALKKSINLLKELLFPEDVSERKKRDRRILDILEAEVAKGPLIVRKMSSGSIRDKGRIRRRRRDVDAAQS